MKTIIGLLLLLTAIAQAQVGPPPATPAEITAGTSNYKYITPYGAAQAGLSSPTNGVSATAVTNIVNNNNAATATLATTAITAITATNLANSAIVTPFMYGAHGDGGKEGIGTDDAFAFNAAITAKSGRWLTIDGLDRDYKINTSIVNWSNRITFLRCHFFTTNATLSVITNGGNYCSYLDCTWWGPGTNANGRQPLTGSIGLLTTTRPWWGAFQSQLTLRNCHFEGFDIGVHLGFLDTLFVDQCSSMGNKTYAWDAEWLDHATFSRAYGGFNNVATGLATPNEYFTTNGSPAWISNCVAFHIKNFNALSFYSGTAAYSKRGYELDTGQNAVIINYNSEDFYDASSGLRTVGYATNVRGLTVIAALGQKIASDSSTNLFKWVLADCPADTVSLDLGARYEGTTPQLGLYYSPAFISGAAGLRQLATPLLRGNVYVRWLTNITSFYGDTTRPDVQWDSGTIPNLAYFNEFRNTNTFTQIRNNQSGFSSLAGYQQFIQTVAGNQDEGFGFMIGGPGAGNFITSAFDFGFIPMSGGVVGDPLFWVNRTVGNGYLKGTLYATNGVVAVGGSFAGNAVSVSNAVDLIAGSNVTINTNANGRTYTIASSGGGSITLTNTTQTAGKITGTSPGTVFGIGTNGGTAFWIADTSGSGGYTNLIGYSRWENDGTAHLTLSNSYVSISGPNPTVLAHSVYFDAAQNYFIVGNDSPLLFTGIPGDFNLHNGYMNSNYITGGLTVGGPITSPSFYITDLYPTNTYYFTNGVRGDWVIPLAVSSTNISANITVGGISGVDHNFWRTGMLRLTNGMASNYKITFPAGTDMATNNFVLGTDVWCSNYSTTIIAIGAGYNATNVAASRFSH